MTLRELRAERGCQRPPGQLTISTVGVLALQGDVREHLAAFGRCGATAVPVRLAAELESVDALAIPGGEFDDDEQAAARVRLEEPLRAPPGRRACPR